jgi:hypothetical protein
VDEDGRGVDRAGRRSKRFLTPLQKYEIWLALLRQEVTTAEAAATHRVDRSTVVRIREVAKLGALAALSESRPGAGYPPSPAHNTEPVLRDTSSCSCSVPTDVDRAVPVEVRLTRHALVRLSRVGLTGSLLTGTLSR